MQFKHLGLALALAIGVIGTLWVGVSLQRIFQQEYVQGAAALDARRDTLLAYARAELFHTLNNRLKDSEALLQERLSDPLLSDTGLLWLEPSTQRLPRLNAAGSPENSNASTFYQQLSEYSETSQFNEDEPQEKRLALLQSLREAVQNSDEALIEERFRALLAHGASWRLAPDFELAFWTVLINTLSEKIELDRQLLNGLLRDGMDDGVGNRLPGLQRALLRQREQLSPADFEFLSTRITTLSQSHNIRYDDFEKQAAQTPGQALDFPWRTAPDKFIWQSRWYVEKQDLLVRGIVIDPAALLAKVVAQMQAGKLLGTEETISLSTLKSTSKLADLELRWHSNAGWQAGQDLQQHYWLKSGWL
ncbi:MAG: hypothetical protein AAF512_21125, partial [Pseudomonadota bacterium]